MILAITVPFVRTLDVPHFRHVKRQRRLVVVPCGFTGSALSIPPDGPRLQ
jgi:hypothetical protein